MEHPTAPEPDASTAGRPAGRHRTALLTLVFTDIIGSVQLKQDLGDHEAMALIEQHDAALRELLARFPGAREMQVAGDSFCLVFGKPSDATRFALQLQARLRGLARECGHAVLDRIGIHVGEVLLTDEEARPIGGIQIDTAARIMAMGGADQILLSRFAFDSARQALSGEEMTGIGAVSWLDHGLYTFKGVEEPVEVCEAGETGQARLAAPENSKNAHRITMPDGEAVLGWRPACGVTVPGTSWTLQRCLGEGGFGEVWLATQAVLKQRRVFKFCFRADRVRSLKREAVLFRILRERVGEHPGIVKVHDVYFDEPPYYLVMDYVEGDALPGWARANGGLAAVPLEVRLAVVAQVADALQAAHDAGVLHRDVKPANILVEPGVEDASAHGGNATAERGGHRVPSPGTPRASAPHALLSDFGIGQVTSEEALAGITRIGFTRTILPEDSATGTQIYMAPELLAGQPATARSDIYSLGVVLFQMVVGDFARPLTTDWADAIDDPLLREDLARCFAGDQTKRFPGAAQLATNLRSLGARQSARESERTRLAQLERRAYRRGVLRAAAVALLLVLGFAAIAIFAMHEARRASAFAAAESQSRGQMEAMVTKLQLQRADEFFSAGNPRAGIAYLAAADRRGGLRHAAAERMLSAIRDLSFPLPVTPRMQHSSMAVDIAFSPDGARLAVVTNGATHIWDATTGAACGAPIPFGGFRAAWSPDGRRLGVMNLDARIFDVTDGRLLAELDAHSGGGKGEARPDLVFSRDWRLAVTIAAHRTASLWDPQTGRRIGAPMEHPEEVWCVALSPDGTLAATGCADGKWRLWETETGTLRRQGATGARVLRIAFSPDGARLLTGSLDGSARLWETATGDAVGPVMKHEGAISSAAFSPDGGTLLTAGFEDGVSLWEVETGEPMGSRLRDRYITHGARFSPDGRSFLTHTAEGIVALRDVRTRERVCEPIQPDALPYCVAFSPDGARVATGCTDGIACVWDVRRRSAVPLRFFHGAEVRDAEFSPDGARVVTAGGDGTAKLWELATGRSTLSLPHRGGAVRMARFSGDGAHLFTIGDNGGVRGWDSATGQPGADFSAPAPIIVVESARSGGALLLGSQQKTARVWEHGRPATPEFGAELWSAALTPDGRRAVLAMGDVAAVFDARTGLPITPMARHKAKVAQVRVSPDGRWFATASWDNSARVWNVETGLPVSPEMKHANTVNSVAWSADGRLVATTSFERVLHLWDAATGERAGESLPHPDVVTVAAFHPTNSHRLLTGCGDGTVRLWDLESRMLAAEPRRIGASVVRVAFSPDGEHALALGERAGVVEVWDVGALPRPAPGWLGGWAEAVAGLRLDPGGALRAVEFERMQSVRESLAKQAGDDVVARTARWFFSPPEDRTLSPRSAIRVADHARLLNESGAEEARELAQGLLGPAMVREWETARRKDAASGFPDRSASAAPQQIDLSSFYNCRLEDDMIPGDAGNTLAEVPRGLQTFAGVLFDVRGIVQLGAGGRMRHFPRQVTGIPVGMPCRALHFVHAAQFVSEEAGAEIARYVVRYADGQTATVPLVDGRDIADWWTAEPAIPLVAAWQGANPLSRSKGGRLSLCKTTWTNPRPETPVASIDFVCVAKKASPFLIGITAE